MLLLGIDPGRKSGWALIEYTSGTFEDIDLVMTGTLKELKEIALFIPKFNYLMNKIRRFYGSRGNLMIDEAFSALFARIFLEQQYLNTGGGKGKKGKMNPNTMKVIVQRRVWWEVELYRIFGNIIEDVYPSSWQSALGAGGRMTREQREVKVREYVLKKFGVLLGPDECAAIGIAMAGLKRMLMADKKRKKEVEKFTLK